MLPSIRLVIMVMAAAPIFLAGTLYDGFVGIGVLYVILLAIYTTIDAALLTRPKHISIKRIAPERVSIGSPTRIVVEIENLSRRHLRIDIAENLPGSIEATPAANQLSLNAGQRKTVEYRLLACQRGRHTIPFMFVRVLPMMGLLCRQFKHKEPLELQVYPNLMDIRKYELLTRRGLSNAEGLAKLRRIGQGSEFESLRHYTPGDEISRVDWKATAKRSRLIIRNYEPERQQNVTVAIDVGRATVGEFGGLSRLDYLINATLMLAYVTLSQKDWFSVLAFSDRIETYLPPINGIKNLDRVAKSLFELQPRLVESDYGAACKFMGIKNRKRSLLCLMTDIISPDASSVIIAYMSRYARYHLPLAITLTNPEIDDIANEPLTKCKDAHSKAVALDIAAARKEAITLMRQRGIGVLDVPPDKLTPELINRYVMIKSQNRL